jgi:predicted  nucleic acid-binding Zn-ribbon protein
LYKALDNRDNIIAQLERKLEDNHDFETGSKDGEYNQLLSEAEDAKREITEYRHTISELNVIVNQCNIENESLKEDKKELEEQIQSQYGVLEVQKKKLFETIQRSDEVKRRQRNDTDEQYNLELENQRYLNHQKLSSTIIKSE